MNRFILTALLLFVIGLDALYAQPNGDPSIDAETDRANDGAASDQADAEAPDATPNEAGPSAPSGRQVGQYPPVEPFFRGNGPGPQDDGWYLSFVLFVPVIGLFFLWSKTSHWVDKDSRELNMDADHWSAIILGGGAFGFLSLLALPFFLLGFVVLLAGYGVPLGLYIKQRNDRVPDSAKVLTPDHIRKVTRRTLARFGIHIGSDDDTDVAAGPPITFLGKSTTGRSYDEASSRKVENSRGFMAAKELIYDAILRRSTDVHLEPKDDELAVRIRIDGVMYPSDPFNRVIGDAVINIFKVLSAIDITEKRRAQDGSFRAELEGRQVDFRVATQGTRHGEKMSLRILDQTTSVNRVNGLGLRKHLQQQLIDVISQPHGLFLCCGPTGAGKSTTLYACINELNTFERNVITIEDPVEYKIDNVNQIEINTKAGQTFANSLRSILRQDPDVVMIGEIRDGETANIACQAANTGHMVFSTVHANDTITALYRFLELDVEPFMVANSITAIMGQRLARKLCPECKEAYRPNPEFLKKAGLPPGKVDTFYRPPKEPRIDCPGCGGLGFSGRTGVFEMLMINDRIREIIRDKGSMSAIRAEARKSGMLYMKEEGLRLVVRGVTSVDEMLRVVK